MAATSAPPILIVGLARSGTTLTSHFLGAVPGNHIEIEPHPLWKCGSFRFVEDDTAIVNDEICGWIRSVLQRRARGKRLVEKSPPNCLRPRLLHAVFPEAKIVYVERDPVRCIASNVSYSLARDTLKPSSMMRKFVLKSDAREMPGTRGSRSLMGQVRAKDMAEFSRYIARLLYLRNVRRALPFGPKIRDFPRIILEHGFVYYHAKVWWEAEKAKETYRALYGANMEVFRLERLQTDRGELRRMYDFCGLKVERRDFDRIASAIREDKVRKAHEPGPLDAEILTAIEDARHDRTK